MRNVFQRFFKPSGFTLVEIVLVIALIGVASSVVIALVDPISQFKKSNDARRKADLRQIQAALEIYRADVGSYPPAPLPICGVNGLSSASATYMQKIPCDPKNTGSGQFVYNYTTNASTYILIACLENLKDPQKDATNALNPSGGTYCDGTTAWSYTLTNP